MQEIGTDQLNPLLQENTKAPLILASFQLVQGSIFKRDRSYKCNERVENYKFRKDVEN